MDEHTHELKIRRGIYLLPNLFTTAALFAGFYAVLAAMQGRFEAAALAIFAGVFISLTTGKVHRFIPALIGAALTLLVVFLSFRLLR